MNVDPTAHGPDTLAVSGHPCPVRWSTAAFGLQPDARPGEDLSLGEHLHHCRRVSGRLFGLQCGVEAAHAYLSGRVVTTLAVVMAAAAFAFIVS